MTDQVTAAYEALTAPERRNAPKDLMVAFGCPERPLSMPEYSLFWKALTEDEKQYYRTVNIETGEI